MSHLLELFVAGIEVGQHFRRIEPPYLREDTGRDAPLDEVAVQNPWRGKRDRLHHPLLLLVIVWAAHDHVEDAHAVVLDPEQEPVTSPVDVVKKLIHRPFRQKRAELLVFFI